MFELHKKTDYKGIARYYYEDKKGRKPRFFAGAEKFDEATPFIHGLSMIRLSDAQLKKYFPMFESKKGNYCIVTENGEVSDPFSEFVQEPTIYGVAICGSGKYQSKTNGAAFKNMFQINKNGDIYYLSKNATQFFGNTIISDGDAKNILDIYGEPDKIFGAPGNRRYSSVKLSEVPGFLEVKVAGEKINDTLYRDILGNLSKEPTLLGSEFHRYLTEELDPHQLDKRCFENERFVKALKISESAKYDEFLSSDSLREVHHQLRNLRKLVMDYIDRQHDAFDSDQSQPVSE